MYTDGESLIKGEFIMQEILSWSPQVRNRWYYSPLFLVVVGIIVFLFVVFGLCMKSIELVIFVVGLYIAQLVWVWVELGRWDVSGYRTMTVDRAKQLLIFDNKFKIPFSAISEMSFDTLPPPERPWWFGDRMDVFEHLGEFNSFLEIKMKSGECFSFAIQDRFDAQDIIKCLKLCGFNIYMTSFDEADLKRSWINYIFIIITVFVIVSFLVKLFGK